MALFQRHQLQQEGDSYTLILYLDPSMTEFADDLGNNKSGAKEKLESSVKSYIKDKFPNLKVKAAKIMLGSMMVATIPLGAMTAQAAEPTTAVPISAPAVTTQVQLPDVQGTKYEQAVNILTTIGVIAGKDDGKYHPADNLSRSEFAKFAVYAAGFGPDAEKLTTPNTVFSDVSSNYWGAKYIKIAKDKGLMEGIGNNQFNPLGDISYEEVVTVLQRIQGYSDDNLGGNWPTNYVNLANQNGINTGTDFAQGKLIDRGNTALLLRNVLEKPTVTYNTETSKYETQNQTLFAKVFGDKFILKDGQVIAVDQAPYSFVAQQANTAKSLKLTFNKPVMDTDAVEFTVKRGASTLSLSPTWSNDKMSVVLSSDVKLAAGTYAVTVNGLDDAGARETSIAVEAEKITAIEIVGDKLIKTDNDDLPNEMVATYKVFNQYNEDVTRDPIANGITWNASTALQADKKVDDNNRGQISVPAASDLLTGTKVVLTGIDTKTGTVITKTMDVADMAQVASMKIGNVIYPEGTDKLFTDTTFRIPFEAVDQYGNKITSESELTSAVSLFSNAGTFDFVTEDGESYLEFRSPSTAQKVVLTAVSKSTGATTNVTLDVVAQPAPATVEVENYDKVIAANDKAGSVVIPLNITDQFGNKLNVDQIASNANKDKIRVTASGALEDKLAIATSGPNKGKIVNTAQLGTTTGPAVVMITIPDTGKTAMLTLNVSNERVLTDIVAPKDIATNLLQGASYPLKFQFIDQYGETVTPGADNPDYSYKLTVTKVSGDDGAITVSATGLTMEDGVGEATDETKLRDLTVQSVAGKTGTYRITAELIKDNSTISQSAVTFSSFEATGDLTYSVADLRTLYIGAAGAGGEDSVYAVPLNITAKDAQGKEYVINPDDIISVTDSKGMLTYDKAKKVLYVTTAADVTNALDGTGKDTLASTVTVVFNTTDEVKTITKDITIATATPEIQSFSLINSSTAPTDDSSKLPTGATTLTSLTGTVGAGGTVSFGDVNPYLVGQNQYGVYEIIAKADLLGSKFTITNENGVTVPEANVTLTDGKLAVSNVTFAEGKSEGSFRIIVNTDHGTVAYYNVNLTKGGDYTAPSP